MAENKAELISALAKATLEFEPIKKDGNAKVQTKTGGQYSYSYATLDMIINATKKALSNNGLNIRHYKELKEDGLWLISELRHISGCESDKTESPIDKFMGDSHMSIIQNFGSISTYLRRYHMSELLNLAIDEDDDGAGNPEPKGKLKDKPKEKPIENAESLADDPSLAYIARINEIDNIYELNNYANKHTPDFKKLSKEDQEAIRKLLATRRAELQDKQDKINAGKAKQEEGNINDPEPDLDGLGDGEKEHNLPA